MRPLAALAQLGLRRVDNRRLGVQEALKVVGIGHLSDYLGYSTADLRPIQLIFHRCRHSVAD